MHLALACWLALLLSGPVPAEGAASIEIGPVRVIRPNDGPLVLLREQPDAPVVAVLLMVPVDEPPGLEGAARLLQHLARDQLEAEARRFGGRIEMRRTPGHAVYEAVGPAGALSDLARLLRTAVGEPSAAPAELERARAAAKAEAMVELETPEPLLLRRLRERLYPDTPDVGADAASLVALTTADLRRFWSTRYRPVRMRAVVTGRVTAEEAQEAFRRWPEPRGRERAVTARAPQPLTPDPQLIAPWLGVAYDASGTAPAALAVLTVLVERSLQRSWDGPARAETWWAGPRRALVVTASYRDGPAPRHGRGSGARAGSGSAAERLRRAIAEAGEELTAAEVAQIRRKIRRDLNFAARTPQGLARVIAEFYERTGDPDGAPDFLAELDRVDARAVQRALRAILDRTPVTVELTP